ncbi:helix-turn-helix domain-containing protein [Kribbella sp. NPDC051620]|uniref:AraC-like ligand-binding domain-containing protein n=1 Tax=Kribbella sp. NPDC051620 TaxID=3364120 RepID=UPI0037AFEBB7
MIQIVDSRTIEAGVRAETMHAVAARIIPVELDFPEPGPVVRGRLADLGELRISSIRSNGPKVERTPILARDDLAPSLMLGLQVSGSSLVVQDGREAVVRPGDIVVYSSTSPYTLADSEGYRQHQFRMPLERLALPRDVVRQVTATRLSPGHPVASLAAGYFRQLAGRPEAFAGAAADAVSRSSMELIRAVISTHLDVTSAATKAASEATLQLRILEYVRAHLGDPSLNAARIAAEHHISRRQLYNVLAEGGISLGDWIRSHRLKACRDELGSGLSQRVAIASVAQRWGFRDPSSFGRLFRAEYGLSPRQWRQTATKAQPDSAPGSHSSFQCSKPER